MPEIMPSYDPDPSRRASVLIDNLPPDHPLATIVIVTMPYPAYGNTILNGVSISSRQGEERNLEEQDLYEMGYRKTGYAFNLLMELCARLGTNRSYSLQEAGRAVAFYDGIESTCKTIARAMPPEVFAMEAGAIAIGNIAFAGRQTTADDVALERRRWHEEDKAEVDKDKQNILAYDHVRITVANTRRGEQRYYMPLDRGNALLAARVLAALESRGTAEDADGTDIASAVWGMMPTVERELFLVRKQQIVGPPSAIKPLVLEIMRKLTNVMGITRETSGERFLLEGTTSVDLRSEAPESAAELHGFRPVFPPGTDRERIKVTAGDPIPSEAVSAARLLLERQLDSTEVLSQSTALTLLDLITDANVKRAIRQQIKETGAGYTSSRVLETLRGQVERTLGDGFYDAWRNRMIAGNNAIGDYGNARQVSGSLPIITNPARFITKRWHIGIAMG